ncbi:Peptidoglycan/LPS O-acetylase OafA/YrhL, contains acyltransferase and SGNH-hydrolase domains [Sphingopyxis sp. YR583]|uniref:acyltransferase family protein n=1 Tax=Sphingopyxis sp. YR583 TaxID=1881047 RepID=UPI0008A7AB7C|nr:acyltransferase [Sphingopyxis sp. YR583]SEH17956.1 Peptidoglycan/LPS O-acetylase OafA/YrhL, contains acyltransferase and SGNH-hydrolase domains [Sphingopyxis sp. YR583]
MTAAVPPGRMLPTLTGLRGFAALAVLLYHIRGGMTGFLPDRVISVLAQGYLAVDLFFVLSGFVLWWTYGGEFRDRGMRAAPQFIVRRFARIFPLHLAILSAMVLFAAALIVSGRDPGEHYSFAELPAHYLLVQNWGFSDRLAWNDPAWSISTEWAAYLLLAITGGWMSRLPRGAWSFPLLIVAMAAGLGWWFAAGGHASIGDDIPATGLLRCLVEFGIGILLCQWWTAQRERPGGTAIIYGTALALSGIAALLFGMAGSQPAAIPLIMTAIVILALQASTTARPMLSGRFAQWLGDISYAVYLSHFFLWILFKLFFVDDPALVHPAKIAGFVVLTLAASHLLHIALEVPARRMTQRLGDRLLAAPRRFFAASRSET